MLMIERLILEIDSFLAYQVIGKITRKLNRGRELSKRNYGDFYQAKDLIRRRDYHVTGNRKYFRQCLECRYYSH